MIPAGRARKIEMQIQAAISSAGLVCLGNVWYVNSATGSDTAVVGATDGFGGNTPTKPFDTIDYAIGQCVANNGDIIVVMPGHTETVAGAAGINLDVAGVTVLCVGHGTNRPTITLSAVASTIAVGAANCRWFGGLVTVSDDATIVFDVNSTDFLLQGCEMRNSASKEAVTWIDINGGSANACDRATIRGCRILCPAVGTTGAIELGEVADNVVIEGCHIDGDFGDACIHNPTGKVLTKLTIKDCTLRNTQTGDHAIELVSACTGILQDNRYYSDITQATAADPGSCFSCQCFHDDVIDASGILSPAAT